MLSLIMYFGLFFVVVLVAVPTIEKIQAIHSSSDPSDPFSSDINGVYNNVWNKIKHDENKVIDSVSHVHDKLPGGLD